MTHTQSGVVRVWIVERHIKTHDDLEPHINTHQHTRPMQAVACCYLLARLLRIVCSRVVVYRVLDQLTKPPLL